ncbi:Putative lipoprotein [Bacillus subtilis QB928]|nr:Putative lipoprotein [Bacillus subtilis QB928]
MVFSRRDSAERRQSMRRIGLCISLLVTVLVMSACESEGEAQMFADCDQKTVKQTAAKPMSSKKKQDFQALASDRQLAIVFSSMIQVSEAFDYGIGNPEYFVRISMTEEEADIAKENLESIKLENKSLKKQNSEAVALLQKTRNQDMSRIEIQQLTENRAGFFETADSMIKLINQVTPKNAKKTRQQLDQLKKQYTQYSAESIKIMNSIVKKQKADKASFERHLEALLQKQPGQQVRSELY